MPPLPVVDVNGRVRKERLAVNLYDVMRMGTHIRQMMLGGNLDLTRTVRMSRTHPDEEGVIFSCDLLQAACLCDIMRRNDTAAGDYPTRVYVSRGGTYDRPKGWVKVPSGKMLTVSIGDGQILSPKVFPEERPEVDMTPPPVQVVRFGDDSNE